MKKESIYRKLMVAAAALFTILFLESISAPLHGGRLGLLGHAIAAATKVEKVPSQEPVVTLRRIQQSRNVNPKECDPEGGGVGLQLHSVEVELHGKSSEQFHANASQFLKKRFEQERSPVDGVRIFSTWRISGTRLGYACCHVKSGHYTSWEYCWD